ncbi:MAG: ATP-binding cassette domain-containing protein [candidate division Zixibacteria bacterium]|nr:ATP-binding cassette domain-containing protein [candidate division Zixibacteria bacterium]
MPLIQMQELNKKYNSGKVSVEALKDINVDVEENEFIAIVGPSGSGKSTLMNIMGCLDAPSSGDYILDGAKVSDLKPNRLADIRNRKIGFVFQNFNLLPYASAYENVELPLIFGGIGPKRRKSRVMELLDRVGLADRAEHKPTELSGGEMQRVAIARALANNPAIILADEPTGNLDSVAGGSIMEIFHELHRDGATLIVITHDRQIANNIPRVIKLKDGLVVDSL